MKIADWHRIMQPGAIIRAIPDPRLSLRVGPAHGRIDGPSSFRSYKEHARLMTAMSQGSRPAEIEDVELANIMCMPLGNHPKRGLTCSRP